MAKAIISKYISMESVVKLLCELRVDNITVNGKRLTEFIDELPTVDEKEILRKPMERIKERIDEKMESVDYWTKPFDKYEYYDNGFWEGMNEVATIVKEEGGIE